MSEARRERADSSARTAADIEDGVELAAGRRMVVYDNLVQSRVVVAAVLGVVCALLAVEGAKCGFCRERGRC